MSFQQTLTTSGIPAPSQTAASENDSSGTTGLSDAQIWQRQFAAYQQWAQQYMVEEDSGYGQRINKLFAVFRPKLTDLAIACKVTAYLGIWEIIANAD